MAHIRIAFWI